MKYTLLELVQAIVQSMSGHEINSITDTQESRMVALMVKENYFNIAGIADLPEHHELFELTATSASTPSVMTLPSDILNLAWVKYNIKELADTDNDWQLVRFLNMDDFLDMTQSLDSDLSTVDQFDVTFGSDTISFKCRNDIHPTYYTTTNDNTLIFDSYNSAVDASLQKSKTMAYGLKSGTWTHSDGFTPDLDAKQFQLLLNETRKQAFIEYKQQPNPNSEKKARDNWINLQRTKRNVPSPIYEYSVINGYGRKGPVDPGITKDLMRKGS